MSAEGKAGMVSHLPRTGEIGRMYRAQTTTSAALAGGSQFGGHLSSLGASGGPSWQCQLLHAETMQITHHAKDAAQSL